MKAAIGKDGDGGWGIGVGGQERLEASHLLQQRRNENPAGREVVTCSRPIKADLKISTGKTRTIAVAQLSGLYR